MTDPIILEAHGRHAQAVLFSQDNQTLLSAGMDAKIHLWSVPEFDLQASFEGHSSSANTLSFNPEQDLLASGSSDPAVILWSFPDGGIRNTIDKQVSGVFSPEGMELATVGANRKVTIWRGQDFSEANVLSIKDKRIFTLAYSPEGDRLAAGGTGSIHIMDPADGSLITNLPGHQHAVSSLRFLENGERLISIGAEAQLIVWDTQTWEEISRIELPGKGVLQSALSPDENLIYISMDNLIQGYDLASGEVVFERKVDIKGVYGLGISPDGSWLANAGADGKIRIFKLD